MPKPRKWKPRKRTTTSAIFFALAFLTRVFTVEISANEDALDGIENTIDLLEKQLNEMTGEQKSSKKGVLLDDGTTANARGGTELMSKELQDRVPKVLLDRWHVVKSRVRDLSEDKRKPNALWFHDLPNDVESAHLKQQWSRERFDLFVFVSEWQRKAYESVFGDVFKEKAVVLRNAIEPFARSRRTESDGTTIRLIYHTTPHRGLGLLVRAFVRAYEARKGKLRLDVYSSFSIYGWGHRDEPFEELFDVCREHPGCEYHGAVSNAEVREALTKAHIFAYPSIWQETSCIAAIEALSAGVHVVTSNLGALPETLGTFATMYQYVEDAEEHLAAFERALSEAIDSYWSREKVSMRRTQQVYASQVFGWGNAGFAGRADDWVRVLGSAHELFNGKRTLERRDFNSDSEFADALFVAGRVKENRGDVHGAMAKYRRALELNELNSYALVSLGVLEMTSGDNTGNREMANRGVEYLEFAIDNAERLSPPLKPDSAAYYGAAVRSGYYREIRYQHARAVKSFDLGLNTSQAGDSDCWDVYRATMVPHFPLSPEEERETIRGFNAMVDALLARDDLFCQRENALANAFSVAYYYTECDYKEEYSKWVRLKATLNKNLEYFSPRLAYERDDRYLTSRESKASLKRLKSRKIKLGVVSSFFTPDSSIWGNFGYVVRGLQQDKRFEVDFVYFPRNPITKEDKLLSLHPESNIYLEAHQMGQSVLDANRKKIEARKFDVLLYLDLHMTGEMHDYAMAKLAPVQITTHGHPVTSGIPELIMDYFLSWDLAELPDKLRAQTFYTEKLLLINSNKQAWEYFVPRTKDEVSVIKGHAPFSHFTRENIDFIPDEGMRKLSVESATWYFCPQAAFKYHVTFDRILGEIQKRDSSAVIILMQLTSDTFEDLHFKVIKRLSTHGGVDLSRVVFVPRMQHYQLMAMYKLSDVVLDSVYFGGDTTTREAFEVGSPVVTLPGKTIGQRWTQAYYKVMGILDYVVDTADEYVSVATKFANADGETKLRARERIKTAYHEKLVANPEAPKLWGDAIFRAATAPTRWHWHDQVGTNAKKRTRDEF